MREGTLWAVFLAALIALVIGVVIGGLEEIDCAEAPNPNYCEMVTQ